MRHHIFATVLVPMMCLLPSSAEAVDLLDDFEDGNFTANPAWYGHTSYYAVVVDPLDSRNHVLQGSGTVEAHKNLRTTFPSSIPWQNFSFSIDLMSSVPTNFRPYIQFGNAAFTTGYSWMQFSDAAHLYDYYVEAHPSLPPSGGTTFQGAGQSSPYAWYRLTLSHNQATDPDHVAVELKLRDSGQVIFQGVSSLLGPLSDPSGIAGVSLWTEETTLYWYDNITLTTIPEPATLGLFVLGGMAILRRRSRAA